METIVFNCTKCSEPIKADKRDCGKDGACPTCGQTIRIPNPAMLTQANVIPPLIPPTADQPSPSMPVQAFRPLVKQTSGLAIASLVCGILSLLCMLFGGVILAIVGIFLSIAARDRIRRQPDRWDGNGLAIAGLITSIVGLVVGVIAIMVVQSMVASMEAMQDSLLKRFTFPPPR